MAAGQRLLDEDDRGRGEHLREVHHAQGHQPYHQAHAAAETIEAVQYTQPQRAGRTGTLTVHQKEEGVAATRVAVAFERCELVDASKDQERARQQRPARTFGKQVVGVDG